MTREASGRQARVRAPELAGRGWLNTGGKAVSLTDLRGKITLLDFWTFCCVNCLHVLDELRPIEREFADVLVTIGVHSPKFEHEADPAALADAVERYGVGHPVLDDPELLTWRHYAVRAWPTLVVIDPEGYVVAQLSGEGHGPGLVALLRDLVAEHEARGTLHRGHGPYAPPVPVATTLRFPGKALALPGGSVLVADTGHHQLVEMGPDAESPRRRIGVGERGLADGPAEVARFSEPQGLAALPPELAAEVGYDVLVADTVNHALRGVRLADGEVRTVAGTGRPWMRGEPTAGPAGEVLLSSPWDVVWWPALDRAVVAMAGVHQLWTFDPRAGEVAVLAGTTNEGLVDGGLVQAWFAQPSGLAVDPRQPETLWLVDSETSALRRVRNGVVTTVVGQGLFDFGHVDGPAGKALLQHPLGLCVLPDGTVAVTDTYNGAVRRYDPVRGEVSTLARGLAEPADAVLVEGPDDGSPLLLVVESSGHRLSALRLPEQAQRVDSGARRTQRPPIELPDGRVLLRVPFAPPGGQKLDDRFGPSTHLVVSSSPASLLIAGAGGGTELERDLVLATPETGEVLAGVLHVSARAASCDDESDPGFAGFAACHVHQQDWGVPVRVVGSGGAWDGASNDRVLELPLRGVAG